MDIRNKGHIVTRIDTLWTDKQFSTYFNRSRDELWIPIQDNIAEYLG